MTTKVKGTEGIEFPDATVQASAAFTKAEFGVTTGTATNKCVRFADGTQICYYRDARADVDVTTAYGSLFIGTCAVNFIQEFIAAPVVTCGEFSASSQAGWGSVVSVTSSGTVLRGLDIASRGLGTAFNISMMAVGRWKA